MRKHRNKHTGKARELRTQATEAERKIWRHLRNRTLGGYKFRRQVPFDFAIADFVCEERNLIIEIDGGQHNERKLEDEQRTKLLENEGYRVIRFWNNQVLGETEAVLAEILRQLQSVTPHPSPLPTSGEREQ